MNDRTSATEKMLAEHVYHIMLRGCYHKDHQGKPVKTKYLGCSQCYDILNSLIVFARESADNGVRVSEL